jgi:mono/diheme cytochrome c family protein
MKLRVGVLMVVVWAAAVSSVPRAGQATPASGGRASAVPVNAPEQFGTVVTKYCAGCHNERNRTSAVASGVLLDKVDLSRLGDEPEMWEKVIRKLRTGSMPPAGLPRPDEATHDALVSFLETTLDRRAAAQPNPGRHLPHRLNRAEYQNAIRDLLALEVDASTLLPPDDSADGFDNNADLLGVSPALLERYLSAAAKISALAVNSPSIGASSETYRIRGDASQTGQNEALPPGTRGGLMALHTFPLDGEYVIKVKLLEINLGSIRGLEYEHQLEVTVDGERVLLAPVGGAKDYTESSLNATNVVNSLAERLQVRVKVKAGQRMVGAAFLQRSQAQGANRLQNFDRSTLIATDHLGLPHVENFTVSGPFNPTGASQTPSRARVFICTPERQRDGTSRARDEASCARRIVSTLASRAYRRPATDADVASLMSFYDSGRKDGGFERGVELALRAILVSPKFTFRIERDPAGVAPRTPYRIGDLELASRLSFFLWSSIPDDELREEASRGRLRRPEVLERQVRRMLDDPRAEALVANFAGQWLHIRNLRNTTPDKNDFPNFDDNLRQAFERELNLFVGSIIAEDRSVLDLMTADYTFVNERLAKHYGIPNIYGPHFRRVTLTEEPRKGLLGKGGILLVTSHADRTSPVVRGKWVLDNLIGTPPPPAPAEVPAFPEETPNEPKTVRARMEQHRANPTCAACHRIMDPIGLALENFDAVGRWRTHEAGSRIDASGELADGRKIDGAIALREALLDRPEVLVGTMAEKLLTYAIGRGLEADDMPAVRQIVRSAAADDYRFSALVRGIVTSVPFQMRRAE